jgi:hypothetical protein
MADIQDDYGGGSSNSSVVLNTMAIYLYPALRLAAGLGVVWFASGASS